MTNSQFFLAATIIGAAIFFVLNEIRSTGSLKMELDFAEKLPSSRKMIW